MKKIDAKGLACPKPVVLTKKALEEDNEVLTIVDNEAASKNVAKLAKKLNCKVSILEENDKLFKVNIKKKKEQSLNSDDDNDAKTYLIDSEYFGEGSPELGKILIKGFLNTLLEVDPLPKKIIFLNSGVKLTSVYNDTVEVIQELGEKNVEILSCGTCLDFYDLKSELKVGEISNMYEIVDSLNSGSFVSV
ncbi:MAG: sulfurtransferase-like selenium metabolism protein YedF [Halanaerobium sp.]